MRLHARAVSIRRKVRAAVRCASRLSCCVFTGPAASCVVVRWNGFAVFIDGGMMAVCCCAMILFEVAAGGAALSSVRMIVVSHGSAPKNMVHSNTHAWSPIARIAGRGVHPPFSLHGSARLPPRKMQVARTTLPARSAAGISSRR